MQGAQPLPQQASKSGAGGGWGGGSGAAAAVIATDFLAPPQEAPNVFAIKTEIGDALAAVFRFEAQKTMYGGKHIAAGDRVYLFDSETQGGAGLVACGVVTEAERVPRLPGIERQTPRVSITVQRTGSVLQRLGREELKRFKDWGDARPETELNFKLYRQATNKIVGISASVAAFLAGRCGGTPGART